MKMHDSRSRSQPAFSGFAAATIIVLLIAVYVVGYAWSAPNTDTADELWHALRIREGIAYPVEGPFLGGAVHFGPAWFYLTAIPLWISKSWLAAALFVGVICALKFPLAYHCGTRLLDRDFGVLWAVAMFVPGWSTIEELVFLNPNAVAMAVLAILALCLHGMAMGMRPLSFAALGLAMALAIHVHPTAMPIFVLAVPLIWRSRPEIVSRALLPLALGFTVPFLPYAVSQVVRGFPDWGSATAYISGQIWLANVVNAPSVVANDVFGGPEAIAHFILDWSDPWARRLGFVLSASALISLAAFFFARARLVFVAFAAALLLFAAWIACLRPTAPVQFTWVLGPVVGGLMALGLWAIGRMPRLRPLAFTIAVASIALNMMVVRAMALTVRAGEGMLPSQIMDIKEPAPHTVYRDVWFPALQHAALGRELCSMKGKVDLHGHLAYVVDKDLGLDTLFECQDTSRFGLIGTGSGSHVFGMTRTFWKKLGASPECSIGSLGLSRNVRPLVSREGLAIADGSIYLPRHAARQPPRQLTIGATAPLSSAVLVTNVLGGYEHFEVLEVRADGKPVTAVARNDLSSLYKPPADAGPAVDWHFTLSTTNAEGIDIVAIDASKGGAGCSGS